MLRVAGADVVGAGPGARWTFAKPLSRPTALFAQEPNRIVIDFHGDLDHGSVTLGTSFTVEDIASGAPVPGGIAPPDPANPNRVVFQTVGTFPTGSYRVRLFGDPPNPIVSTTAVPLDGEPTPAWPTGTGGPGGNCTLVFKVV
jgi:hypothetical protein